MQPAPLGPRIAVTLPLHVGHCRQIMRGIQGWARKHRWRLDANLSPFEGEQELDPDFEGEGWILGNGDVAAAARFEAAGGVVITVNTEYADRFPAVVADHGDLIRCGADHLQGQGLQELAFFGVSGSAVSRRRLDAFERIRGADAASFLYGSTRTRRGGHRGKLERWLRGLPSPCGIIASDDHLAAFLIRTCLQLGRAVPGEVAVLGMNNDELLCHSVNPTLSSGIYDGYRIGREAARMLGERLAGGTDGQASERRVPCPGVRVRLSTAAAAIRDPQVAAAVRFIHEEATRRSVRIDEVCRHASLARRTLIARFQRQLGRSPSDEITRVRLHRSCEVLRGSDSPIKVVAADLGFETSADFARFFRRGIGTSPTEFRASVQPEPDAVDPAAVLGERSERGVVLFD